MSSPRIQVLSSALANQIAAGEVVERPASVVKELLENSLDAGACSLEVEVEQGGVALIRVRDDGRGIHRDDLVLALSRHATSKIRTLDDLEQVMSLGFRGEALPSIASVSRLTLVSRSAGEDLAWRLEAGRDGRGRGEPQPAAHPPGTTVEVRDLFFNTPARRKFLRSERTELGHVEEVVRRIGLSRADLALRLRHGHKELLSLRAAADEAARARRVSAVCGAAFMEQALSIESAAAGLRVWGWVGMPQLSRSQADIQYFYLNGRMVRDRLLSHALRQAYQDLLPHGRYPAYVLYLEMDPTQADVNVHPTKHEVRFREARLVHDFVFRSVARGLAGVSGAAPEATPAPVPVPGLARGHRHVPAPATGVADQLARYSALVGRREDVSPPSQAQTHRPLGRALGAVRHRYVLAETSAGLILLDLASASARVAYLRLRAALEDGGVRGQPLLLPQAVQTDEHRAQAAEEWRESLPALGLELRRSGPASVTVYRIPALLRGAEVGPLAAEVLDRLAGWDTHGGPSQSEQDAMLQSLSRHAPSLAEAGATPPALDALLRELEDLGDTSGAGSIWVEIPLEELTARLRSKP